MPCHVDGMGHATCASSASHSAFSANHLIDADVMALAILLRGALFGLAGTSLTAARSTLPRSRIVRGVATEPALASAAVARDPASHPAFELVRVEMIDE